MDAEKEVPKEYEVIRQSKEMWATDAPKFEAIFESALATLQEREEAQRAENTRLEAQALMMQGRNAVVRRENRALQAALEALTIWSGEQLCFRTANGVPMGMSKKQERLARAALQIPPPLAVNEAEQGKGK